MAFFTPYSTAPLVEVQKRKDRNFSFAIATATQYYQDVEIVENERRGLTDSAADNLLDTLSAAGTPGVIKVPIGGGGYNVRYTSITVGDWTIVP